jgi:hypothetical protein
MMPPLCVLLTLLVAPRLALAQRMVEPNGQTCIAWNDEDACTPLQPVWIGDGSAEEGPLSLRRLAEVTAPILWLSPREFLLLEDREIDAPGRVAQPGGGRTVYYRIRRVRLKGTPTGRRLSREDDPEIQQPGAVWTEASAGLPLDELDYVYITFFFYYPEDRGVGGHPHDLEAMEVRVRMQRACRTTPDRENPPKALRSPSDICWPAAQLESVSGSAHGVGWYTNTLQVLSTRDTVLPLVALVEENKHATSPDRDGDGTYMPHYDVNRQSNDAWGIRDVAGTGKLGGSAFSAELSRARRPSTQVCPPSPSIRLIRYYSGSLTGMPLNGTGGGCLETANVYDLVESRSDSACGRLAAPAASPSKSDERLRGFLRDKKFCAPESATEVLQPQSRFDVRLLSVLRKVSPGPDGQYGFQNAAQRFSFAYRFDEGHGVSAIVPVGGEVPFLGGWAIGRVNLIPETLKRPHRFSSTSYEAMYAPSASRPIDWYVTVGGERIRDAATADSTWEPVEELGIRYRFSAERVRLLRFFGGRVGLRANSMRRPKNVRLVYEFGAGSW